MSDMQKFDDNIIKNLHMFCFKDDEQVYTNGVELVPLYRVVQILEHFKVQELVDKATPIKPNYIRVNSEERYGTCKCLALVFENNNYCKCCGQELDWSNDES